MRSKPRRRTKFGVCIDNTGYPASLEAGKLYPVIADQEAARHGYLRVIDESGEDYLYAASRFGAIEAHLDDTSDEIELDGDRRTGCEFFEPFEVIDPRQAIGAYEHERIPTRFSSMSAAVRWSVAKRR